MTYICIFNYENYAIYYIFLYFPRAFFFFYFDEMMNIPDFHSGLIFLELTANKSTIEFLKRVSGKQENSLN